MFKNNKFQMRCLPSHSPGLSDVTEEVKYINATITSHNINLNRDVIVWQVLGELIDKLRYKPARFEIITKCEDISLNELTLMAKQLQELRIYTAFRDDARSTEVVSSANTQLAISDWSSFQNERFLTNVKMKHYL